MARSVLSFFRSRGESVPASAEAAVSILPPEARLPADLQLKDETDLRLAVRWYVWLSDRLTALESQCRQLAARVEEQFLSDAHVDLGGTPGRVSLPLYLAGVEAAILDYAQEHDAEVFSEGAQRNLPGAVLKRRNAPPKVEIDGDRKARVAQVDDVLRLRTRLLVAAAEDERLRAVLPLVKVTVDFDLAAIQTQYKARDLTDEQLAAWGLSMRTGTVTYSLTPAEPAVT